MTEKKVLALAFHQIGPPPPGGWSTWFYVSEDAFARHLEVIRENGWEVIGGDDFLESIESPERLPERSALLTFDDGYRSIREYAAPILADFGYPGLVFVPTDYVGGMNLFDQNDSPSEPICSWDDLRYLQESVGISVQSHGTSHKEFSRIDDAEKHEQLARSKTAIEAELGTRVEAFAFPRGDASGASPDLLEECGYRTAFLYRNEMTLNSLPGADPYRLRRVAVGADTDLDRTLEAFQ